MNDMLQIFLTHFISLSCMSYVSMYVCLCCMSLSMYVYSEYFNVNFTSSRRPINLILSATYEKKITQ